jgi:hypothetical protein
MNRNWNLIARALSCLVCLSAWVHAATPQLSAIRPPGGQRGTELEVTFSGARLGDAQEVLFYQPGITVTSITKVDDNNVKAKFKIEPDARLGLHDLRLRTATGISELRTFSVGNLPETQEKEPNNDFDAPQAIPFGSLVNGVAENEDIDYFSITAQKGDRISAEVEGIRLGISHFDPYVAILDSKRFELSTSDDAPTVWQDGIASAIAPEDGTYIIAVRESAYAGNGGCLYRLHVGPFPRPRAVLPPGGPAGEPVEITWIGDVAGPRTEKVTLPGSPSRDFSLQAQDEKGLAPYPLSFRLSSIPNVIEAEPNNDQSKATVFAAPAALCGVIGETNDEDHFRFKAVKGQVFDVQCFARRIRSPLDPVVHVVKVGGNYLMGADDNAGPDCNQRLTIPEDGEYEIFVHDHLRKGGTDFVYRIEVTPVAPKLTMSVTTESLNRGTGIQAVAVPKGNRQAILVNASRADFGGELVLSAEGLPAGVAMIADKMAPSIGTYPVVFEAAPEAATAGSLAVIQGAPSDPNLKIPPSTFEQTAELVLGANNVPFWVRTVDKLAVAVTEESPFSIEVVEPKVPLVRGGSMNLKVVARRKEGFHAPIAVSLPWNPPGIGSAGGVSIPEGQNEALIPLNADGGAELRTWKIVVNGSSSAPTGPITVSSQLANLTVAERFIALQFQNAAVEQGKETDLAVKIQKLADFPGEATMTLIGLPNKATTEVLKITKDTSDVVFHIKTDAATPDGNHANLFCQVVITQEGEPILHNLGTGALRVDKPLPPKADAPAPAAQAAPMPQPAAAPAKPLSRLEQLRQEAAEKARAKAGEAAPAAPPAGEEPKK